jgi:hypothetical protein
MANSKGKTRTGTPRSRGTTLNVGGLRADFPQIGDVVRVRAAGDASELGRVCRLMPIMCMVQFETVGCLRVRKADLVMAEGDAPECDGNCG